MNNDLPWAFNLLLVSAAIILLAFAGVIVHAVVTGEDNAIVREACP